MAEWYRAERVFNPENAHRRDGGLVPWGSSAFIAESRIAAAGVYPFAVGGSTS
jgi:hypothetical protein